MHWKFHEHLQKLRKSQELDAVPRNARIQPWNQDILFVLYANNSMTRRTESARTWTWIRTTLGKIPCGKWKDFINAARWLVKIRLFFWCWLGSWETALDREKRWISRRPSYMDLAATIHISNRRVLGDSSNHEMIPFRHEKPPADAGGWKCVVSQISCSECSTGSFRKFQQLGATYDT